MSQPGARAGPQSKEPVDRPLRWEPSIAFLKSSIGFLLIGSGAFEVLLFTSNPPELKRVLLNLLLMLVAAAAWFLLARRKLKAVLWTLGAGVWGYVTIASLFLGGVDSTVIIIYPVVILMSAWLSGARAGMIFAWLTVAATFGFVVLDRLGFLPTPFETHPEMRWIVEATVFMFTAVVISQIVRSYGKRLKEANKLARALECRSAELETIESDLRAAQAIANVGSWVYEFPNDVLRISPEGCSILHLPENTALSHAAFFSYIHADDRKAVDEAWQAALASDKAFDREHRIALGQEIAWVRQRARLERDAEGAPLRALGTMQDITARKTVERMKDEFITLVSHELRTPLTSIVGSLGLLSGMADLSDETRTLVRVGRDNSRRLMSLINDILDMDKLDSGTLKIRLEPVELEALLRAAVLDNQAYAEQYGVRLVLSNSDGPAWVNADADRLKQVMANLLSNAAKFSPRGTSVDVQLERRQQAIRVSVIDCGPGIPEEFKPRMFQRFAQADSSKSRQHGGTGLGLAISKRIMDKLGGRIAYASRPGAGATFYLDFDPLPQAADSNTSGFPAGAAVRD